MTEPKRWDWKDDVVRLRDDLADARLAMGALRRERDRLRDERDTIRDDLFAMALEADEARRVAGVLADAAREFLDGTHEHDGRFSRLADALAVFDTLTEEKTARAREGDTTGSNE